MDWIKNNSQPFVEYLLLISVFSSYFSDKLSRSLNVVVACQVDNNNLCFYLQLIKQIFEEGGKCLFLQEKQLDTTSALTSSGIAFALKYMQAVMQAGIELGIPGKDAMQMAAYSMEGATELILNHNTHPLLEIEKVTTPGGTTIKGLNELEHKGFTSSIIQAIKSSATTLIDKEEEDAKNFR